MDPLDQVDGSGRCAAPLVKSSSARCSASSRAKIRDESARRNGASMDPQENLHPSPPANHGRRRRHLRSRELVYSQVLEPVAARISHPARETTPKIYGAIHKLVLLIYYNSHIFLRRDKERIFILLVFLIRTSMEHLQRHVPMGL